MRVIVSTGRWGWRAEARSAGNGVPTGDRGNEEMVNKYLAIAQTDLQAAHRDASPVMNWLL
jgi:hypothetical protein